jgi:hypothetical protein
MTLYILAGGNDRRYEEFGNKLSQLVGQYKDNPRVLDVYFARDPSVYETTFHNWDEWYQKFFGPNIERRFAIEDEFLLQVEWADVVFLHGGDTPLMVKALEPFSDLETAFEGKIIVGSSAGAICLSRHYYSPLRDSVMEGRGFVNVATVPHFGAHDDGEAPLDKKAWTNAVDKTKAVIEEGELLILLPEGTFVAIEK